MKRGISLVLALVLCLSLCACGKSKSATECEKLINAIGEVSVDSKEAIETADKAYEALTEKEKESIAESAVILEDARSAYIFELSKMAYQNINSAYDITHKFGSDLYQAWFLVSYQGQKLQNSNTVKYLASEVQYLNEEELQKGLAFVLAKNKYKENWYELSEEQQNHYIELAIQYEGDDNIKASWYVVNQMGSDLYSIWHGCIFKKDEMSKNGIQFFVDNTSLNEKDVIEGLASRNYVNEQYAKTGKKWNDVGEDVKQFYRDATIELFEKASKQRLYPDMADSLLSIVNAYALNGMVYNVQQALETAKQNMNELTDDDNYDSLKGFYTTTSNLLDFCMSPSGSFEQYKTLLNDYRKEARNYMNDLDLIFD